MILIVHLLFAFGSVAHATYTLFYPSGKKLKAIYALVALTLASGFALVFLKPSHMAEVCVMGLAYVGYVSYVAISVRQKLAVVDSRSSFTAEKS